MADPFLLAAAGLCDDTAPPPWPDGDSTSDDDDGAAAAAAAATIPGLRLTRRALSRSARAALAAAVAADFPGLCAPASPSSPRTNQAMTFGVLPPCARLAAAAVDTAHWPQSLSARGDPPFNCVAVNAYAPPDALAPHVDLPRYADGVAIVSLGGAVVMRFEWVGGKGAPPPSAAVPVLLRPGDVLTLVGEARTDWTHGFGGGDGEWGGRRVARAGVRVGVTLRWMEAD